MKKVVLILVFSLPIIGWAQTWNDQNSSITNDLEDVYFADNSNGWAVGRQGKIIRTTDGGANWSEQNSGTTKDLNKVFMTGTTNGYAVGDGGTVIKYNGLTWSALNISFSQDMYGVYFLDANTGWVSGEWGRIMMTTNGGSNWTIQMSNSIYSNAFYDLHMLSATEGWAVGSSGRVLEYDGTNWTNIANPATSNLTSLHAVSFISSNDGFMTGESSSVYHWDGNTWSVHNTALSNNSFHVYDVHMVNSSLGYAATSPGIGGGGVILKYNGSTWTKDYEYTGMNSELFTGITTTPNGNIIAVASTGLIKMKTSGGNPTSLNENKISKKDVTVFPNPFSTSLNINFTLKKRNLVTFTIKDLSGKELFISETFLNSGVQQIIADGASLPSGFYFYTLSSPEQFLSGKLLKQ